MAVRRRLLGSQTSTFSAAGIATSRLGPDVYGDIWVISRTVISTTSALATTAKMYLNNIVPTDLIDRSNSANSDISDTSDIYLGTTEKIIIQWAGGTPGAFATMVLYGVAER